MAEYEFVKSSFSGGGDLQSDCVEVASNVPGVVAVRDSKRPAGPIITMGPRAWLAFSRGIR